MKRLIFRAAAASDVERAHRWYEEQRPGLGDHFLEEVESCARRIAENPLAYSRQNRDVRRAPLRRFPHALFYRDATDVITVLACFHAKRAPSRLRRLR